MSVVGVDPVPLHVTPPPSSMTLGRVVEHLALEDARDFGHADLLRESSDGQVGE